MHVDIELVIAMPCNKLDTQVSGAVESDERRMPLIRPFKRHIFFQQPDIICGPTHRLPHSLLPNRQIVLS
jgi:hypothetical protein